MSYYSLSHSIGHVSKASLRPVGCGKECDIL